METEPTRDEIQAARVMGEAILRFLVVHEEARRTRDEQASSGSVQQTVARIEPERKMESPPEKRLLTSREVASLLSISARTVWAMTVPRGLLPCIKVGRAVRYRTEDLEAWIQKSGT